MERIFRFMWAAMATVKQGLSSAFGSEKYETLEFKIIIDLYIYIDMYFLLQQEWIVWVENEFHQEK